MMVHHILAVWKSGLVHLPCVKLKMFINFVTSLTVTVMFEAVLYGDSPKLDVLVTSFVVNTDENCLLRMKFHLSKVGKLLTYLTSCSSYHR